jgi:hypothetical protein
MSEHDKTPHETVSFDFKNSKLINLLIIVLLIAIPMIFSIGIRMQTAYLPIIDKFASDTIVSNIKSQIADQILQESPNLPPATIQKETERRLAVELSSNSEEIKQAQQMLAQNFRSKLMNDKGEVYLGGIDEWTYYRQTVNVVENGHIGDELRDGKPFDNHMLAPLGRFEQESLHPYFSAFVYNILSPITGLSVLGVFFLIPVIISALAVIPAFFIGRKFAGNFGGFVSAFIVAVHPAFISRTAAGFADTDAYNVTFPLLIAWLVIEAFYSKKLYLKIGLTALAAVIVGVYSFTWSGWWFIFNFISGALAINLAYRLISERKFSSEVKDSLILLITFVAVSGIAVSSVLGFSSFLNTPLQPIKFTFYKTVAKDTIWPNVYTTVAEQNEMPFPDVLKTMGGGLMFSLAIIGLLLSLLKNKMNLAEIIILIVSFTWLIISAFVVPDNLLFLLMAGLPVVVMLLYVLIAGFKHEHKTDVFFTILMFIWFIATLYASRQGVRYTLLLVPAFAIGIGLALGRINEIVSAWLVTGFHVPKNISSIVVGAILCLLLISPMLAGYQTSYQQIPMVDDAWWDSLTYIKDNSQPNAIINSWWDFGHWFKAIADRPVTFDGQTQNTPMAHWIGHVLLTDDEDEAIGLLKMLDCGSNTAFDKLDAVLNDSPKSVDILHEIVMQKKEDAAKNLLTHGLTEEQTAEVIKYTHCTPPEDFFITSEDMVGKSGVWSHFGIWDFHRADMFMKVKPADKSTGISILTKEFNLSESNATKTYYDIQNTEGDQWIAPWPSYSQSVSCSFKSNTTLDCSGLVIDFKNQTAAAPQGQMPREIVYESASKQMTSMKLDPKGQYSVAILPGPSAILMSPELSRSMFTVLFFYNGTGLKHFDLAKEATTLTGDRIYVWKVNWEGK